MAVLGPGAEAQAPPAGAVIPPGGTPVPAIRPEAPPSVGPGGQGLAPPVAPSDDPALARTVRVTAVSVEGATAFPSATLLAHAPPPGPAVALRQIEATRAAILNQYREGGYAFTTVDAVLSRDGRLRFVVGEGHITEVKLDGDIGPAGVQVLRFLNRLTEVRPLDIATMERYLLLAGDVPGVALRSVLRPASTGGGALTLVAQVARKAVGGYVTGDNRGYRLTGREQGLAAVQFNSFTSFGERSELAMFYANGHTQVFGQAGTEFFVGSSGTRVRVYAGTGSSQPADPLRSIGYEGTTTVAGLGVSYPVIRRRQQTLILSGAFDVIESETEADGPNGIQERLSRDHLRVVRLGGDWSVFDLLAGDARPAVNGLTLRLSHGLSGFGASDSDDPMLSRSGARTDFAKVNFEASRVQTLFRPWGDATVALQATLAGQWADDVLPQAEKFYLGGSRLGRGYYSGEITGDKALAFSAELQLFFPLEVAAWNMPVRIDPTFYAFYDVGQTWENQASDPNRRIASAGIGLRASLTEYVEVQVEGVHRFDTKPNGTSAFVEPEPQNAVFWRALMRF